MLHIKFSDGKSSYIPRSDIREIQVLSTLPPSEGFGAPVVMEVRIIRKSDLEFHKKSCVGVVFADDIEGKDSDGSRVCPCCRTY